jgi:long-chain acyl-CoA synthetase
MWWGRDMTKPLKPSYRIDHLDQEGVDYIPENEMKTIPALFKSRVRKTPEGDAYQQFDVTEHVWRYYTWGMVENDVVRWRKSLLAEKLQPGDRVGIRRSNGYNWVLFDQAALSLGLVVVPLYVDDRPDNVTYILDHADIKLLYIEFEEQWQCLGERRDNLKKIERVIIEENTDTRTLSLEDARVIGLDDWLVRQHDQAEYSEITVKPDDLATIVYTSGTTGRPKGVMLTHWNIMSNVRAGMNSIVVKTSDRFLSFLPLSHMFERMAGYYLPMMGGGEVVYARSIAELSENLQAKKPTILVSVPRIFERVYGKIKAQLAQGPVFKNKLFDKTVEVGWARYEHRQGLAQWQLKLLLWPLLDKMVASKVRAKLGGKLRFALSGGAPLPISVARVFVGLGVDMIQGYGLTESSPVITVNTLEHFRPDSIGLPVRGVEVKIGKNNELLARGPNIMRGYWKNQQASDEVIDKDGWLYTGDQASIKGEFVYITGRLKEIIVLANGEKVPPADMESTIAEDALFDQCLVLGEQKPYLCAIVVLNREIWEDVKKQHGYEFENLQNTEVEEYLLSRIVAMIIGFPGYAQIHKVVPMFEPWTVKNGLATPTMKIKRNKIIETFKGSIDSMYSGH